MLNPCKPCVCYGAHCEQCMFGCVTEEGNHEQMKELILEVLAGEKPFGQRAAEDYMRYHPDWRNEFTEEELEIAENKPKTAHWIIEDHGFGGSYYRCSECGESWCDLFHNISMEERCPNCDALINDDEEEYTKYKAPVDKNQKLLETLHLFNDSIEGMLFYYINHHPEEFPASRINKLIRTLQDTYITDRISKLENACSVFNERAAYDDCDCVDIIDIPKISICTDCLICGESVELTNDEELLLEYGHHSLCKICDKCRDAILAMKYLKECLERNQNGTI